MPRLRRTRREASRGAPGRGGRRPAAVAARALARSGGRSRRSVGGVVRAYGDPPVGRQAGPTRTATTVASSRRGSTAASRTAEMTASATTSGSAR